MKRSICDLPLLDKQSVVELGPAHLSLAELFLLGIVKDAVSVLSGFSKEIKGRGQIAARRRLAFVLKANVQL